MCSFCPANVSDMVYFPHWEENLWADDRVVAAAEVLILVLVRVVGFMEFRVVVNIHKNPRAAA